MWACVFLVYWCKCQVFSQHMSNYCSNDIKGALNINYASHLVAGLISASASLYQYKKLNHMNPEYPIFISGLMTNSLFLKLLEINQKLEKHNDSCTSC